MYTLDSKQTAMFVLGRISLNHRNNYKAANKSEVRKTDSVYISRVEPFRHVSSVLHNLRDTVLHENDTRNQGRCTFTITVHLHYAQVNPRANFFIDLCLCSMWALNWILYESIWKWCRFRFYGDINEPLRKPLQTLRCFDLE